MDIINNCDALKIAFPGQCKSCSQSEGNDQPGERGGRLMKGREARGKRQGGGRQGGTQERLEGRGGKGRSENEEREELTSS
eukprot:747132-Hanusia_phi.AAC.2